MKLRKILLGLALFLVGGTAYAQPAKDWQDYKKRKKQEA